jgi:hypothetical protein
MNTNPNKQRERQLSAAQTTAARRVIQQLGMDAHPKEVVDALAREGVGVTLPDVRRLQASLAAGAAAQAEPAQRQWIMHEQHADQTRQEAQRLLDVAGSVERAKAALEDAAEPAEAAEQISPDAFAKQLGFASYLDLFEASTPISSADGKAWCLTRLAGDEWIVWNDRDLAIAGRFATQDDALNHFLPQR